MLLPGGGGRGGSGGRGGGGGKERGGGSKDFGARDWVSFRTAVFAVSVYARDLLPTRSTKRTRSTTCSTAVAYGRRCAVLREPLVLPESYG
eukprot:1290238-Rhodomonas_salina.1